MRLSEIASPRKHFEWKGLHIVYNAALWTPRLVAKYGDIEDKPRAEQLNDVIELLSLTLVSWDLTDEQDQPIATTVEALQDVPFALLDPLVEAIMKDAQPSSEEGNDSRRVGRLQPAPTLP